MSVSKEYYITLKLTKVMFSSTAGGYVAFCLVSYGVLHSLHSVSNFGEHTAGKLEHTKLCHSQTWDLGKFSYTSN